MIQGLTKITDAPLKQRYQSNTASHRDITRHIRVTAHSIRIQVINSQDINKPLSQRGINRGISEPTSPTGILGQVMTHTFP